MATAEQIKALIKAHLSDDRESFITTVLQMAAHEAKRGRYSVAHEIRDLIDQARMKNRTVIPKSELENLVLYIEPKERLNTLVADPLILRRLERIIREYWQQDKLKRYGLANRRKILLVGPPGTGKTLTAEILAGELHLPLYVILMDKLVTKFMGETAAKLRKIFDMMAEYQGVYFFDEFDAIATDRTNENDVGEMRRVLNSFLQFIEWDNSDSLIVAATNNPQMLDKAIFRRFDDILYYKLPTEKEIKQIIRNSLGTFMNKKLSFKTLIEEAKSLSQAEITKACKEAIKICILENRKTVTTALLKNILQERRKVYEGLLMFEGKD